MGFSKRGFLIILAGLFICGSLPLAASHLPTSSAYAEEAPATIMSTTLLEFQTIRSETAFLSLDADQKSLLFLDILESKTTSAGEGVRFEITKGILRKMAMDDPSKVETLSPTLQFESGPIGAFLWSPARDQAILYAGSFYLFDRGSQSIVPCPDSRFLGWWGKKTLFWSPGEPGSKLLVTNDSHKWQPQVIASITATLAARTSDGHGLSFIFGDKLMIEYRTWNDEVFWQSIDLRSGAIEQHPDLHNFQFFGFLEYPAYLRGSDKQTILPQADNPPGTQTATEYHPGIWRWQEGQAPALVYEGSLCFTSIAWLDASDFISLRYWGRDIGQGSHEFYTELWHGALQGDRLILQQIGETPSRLGGLDNPVIGSNRTQLWCIDRSNRLVRITLPDIPLSASPPPSWWIPLVMGLFLGAVLWFLLWRRRHAASSSQHPVKE